jgi:hypothetical protein
MPIQGAAFAEPIVFAPQPSQKKYPYRAGMGMVPSAEFLVFMDDFDSFRAATTFASAGWTTILDSGAEINQVQTAALGATGVIQFLEATASEGASIYRSQLIDTGVVQLSVGKRAFIEARVYTNDVTDNSFYFGWSSATVITAAADLWDASAADLGALGITDGSATLQIKTDLAAAGIVTTATTGTMVASTWTTLALEWDGVSSLKAYKDGKIIGTVTSAVLPVGVAVTPFFSAVNGNSGASALSYVDYIRYVIER